MLIDAPQTADADVTSVQRVIYGASPISAAVLERARKRLESAAFTQAYGMTELAPVATLLTPADHEDRPSRSPRAGRPRTPRSPSSVPTMANCASRTGTPPAATSADRGCEQESPSLAARTGESRRSEVVAAMLA